MNVHGSDPIGGVKAVLFDQERRLRYRSTTTTMTWASKTVGASSRDSRIGKNLYCGAAVLQHWTP